MLIRLRYASTLSPDTTTDDVEAIVRWSAINNRKRGVTGVLAVEGSSVIQILEGPVLEVNSLFDRIAADERHQGVVVLDRDKVAKVRFEDWGMVKRSMTAMLLMPEVA